MSVETPALAVGGDGVPRLFGFKVFQGDLGDALDSVGKLVGIPGAHLVVTANVDHVIDMARGSDLRMAYAEASLRVIDGSPLLWWFRLSGAQDVHRVTGADLLPLVAEMRADRGWRVAITGGANSVVTAAAERLGRAYPGPEIAAVPMPMLSDAADPASQDAIASLVAFKPDVVFVCLGAPKQERWFRVWRDKLPGGVYIGAGAAVDFAAGTKRRAPRVVQEMGLEWVWRVFQEFGRLAPRYFVKGPSFVRIAIQSTIAGRKRV